MNQTILDDNTDSHELKKATSAPIKNQTFPSVTERIKAALIDGIIIIIIMFILSALADNYELSSQTKKIIFLCLFGLYDPLFTALFGGTLGHLISGLRVKRESNPNKNVFFLFTIVRFAFKVTLGWISLITVSSNSKSKAIHDLVVGSIVVYKPDSDQK